MAPVMQSAVRARQSIPGEAMAWVELPALPTTPFWARRHAQAVLGAWHVPGETIETALVLVSELVTNAVTATTTWAVLESAAATPIVQTLRRQSDRIVIEISDCDSRPPFIVHTGPDAETGRGLMIVQTLSKEWSYFLLPSGGKTVYCIIGLPPDSAGSPESQEPCAARPGRAVRACLRGSSGN